jgi:glutamine amidotransferase
MGRYHLRQRVMRDCKFSRERSDMAIAIVNYGMANLRSVQKAFEEVGARDVEIVDTAEGVRAADKVVLPGVGAFKDAIATLRSSGLAEPVLEHIDAGKPFLGICLGLQMLFEVGYENGEHRGLGVLKGKVVRFDVDETMRLKVPHMGWNQLQFRTPRSPLFNDLADECGVYFVHSYHVVPDDDSIVAATTDYGRPFVSSVWRDNVMATQFHPEKSQRVGLQILSNFAAV